MKNEIKYHIIELNDIQPFFCENETGNKMCFFI